MDFRWTFDFRWIPVGVSLHLRLMSVVFFIGVLLAFFGFAGSRWMVVGMLYEFHNACLLFENREKNNFLRCLPAEPVFVFSR